MKSKHSCLLTSHTSKTVLVYQAICRNHSPCVRHVLHITTGCVQLVRITRAVPTRSFSTCVLQVSLARTPLPALISASFWKMHATIWQRYVVNTTTLAQWLETAKRRISIASIFQNSVVPKLWVNMDQRKLRNTENKISSQLQSTRDECWI